MNILAIGCHPDDIEYGCGGTLLKYASEGQGVHLLIMTDGSMGGDVETRRAEQMRSAELMGAKNVFWGGYQDTCLPLDRSVISLIEERMRQVAPSLILVHSPDDTHQDHRALSKATFSAARYSPNVLFYEGPTTQNFLPTVFVNISKYVDQKMELLKAHASQVERTNIEDLSIVDLARSNATARGILGRVKSAEAFLPVRLFL